MSDHVSDPPLTALETALKGLTPAAVAFEREQFFFRAGAASARTGRWLWPAASAMLAFTACVLGAMLLFRPEPAPRVVVVTLPAPQAPANVEPKAPPPTSEPAPSLSPVESPSVLNLVPESGIPAEYLRLRDQVLRFGVDALPESPMQATDPPAAPTTVIDMFPGKS